MDIQSINTKELIEDYYASINDIKICEYAQVHGHTHYTGGLIQDRVDTNRRIIEKIIAELQRRNEHKALS